MYVHPGDCEAMVLYPCPGIQLGATKNGADKTNGFTVCSVLPYSNQPACPLAPPHIYFYVIFGLLSNRKQELFIAEIRDKS